MTDLAAPAGLATLSEVTPEVSVVVPVYGCRGCLRALHERLRRALGSITSRFELIFVDDRSPDGSWALLAELARRDPAVRALRLSRNFGQHAAITAGLTHARGRWVVVMDCDLQEAPEDIPRLYARAQEGFDIVQSVRRGRRHPPLRRWASRGYRRLLLEGDRSADHGTLSLISDKVVRAFLRLGDRDREYTLALSWLGFSRAVVDVEHHERAAGASSYTLRRLLRVALDGVFFRTTLPLHVIVFAGFALALAGVGLAGFDIYDRFAHTSVPGYASLAVLVLLLGGFVIVGVGVVGLYVGRIFEQVKGRPLYIVDAQAEGPGAFDAPPLPEPGEPAANGATAAADPPARAPAGAAEPAPSEFLVFGSPLIEPRAIEEVVDSLRSGWVGTGPKVKRFESQLAAYLGVAHVRCLSSCTAGLMLGLRQLGVGPGDEVLVPSMTFVASVNAIEHAGAVPVLIDSDPETGLIDLAAAEAAIGPRTRAIMPVHLAGRPVDMGRLASLRDRHGLLVLEDAAHAIGAMWGGRHIGAHGNPAAFSFYVTKNITTVEGGAIATPDPEVAATVERLALHGLSAGAWERYSDRGFRHYEVVEPGFKFNMTDVQAALGIHQLARLDEWIDARAERWERYDELLADLPLRLPPGPEPGTRHARHLYQVRLGRECRVDRDRVLEALLARGVGVGVHYRAVHLHPYYRDRYGLEPASLPVACEISEQTISLPLSPKVTEADQHRVAGALRAALGVRLTV